MSELTRQEIEKVRVLAQHHDGSAVELFGVSIRSLCDMALRAHDSEVEEVETGGSMMGDGTWQTTGELRWVIRYKYVMHPDPDGRIGAPGKKFRELYHVLQQERKNLNTGSVEWRDILVESEEA